MAKINMKHLALFTVVGVGAQHMYVDTYLAHKALDGTTRFV